MALRPVQVNIKALDDSAVGRFWAAALGWNDYSGGSGVTTYVGPVGVFGWPGPVARLQALGAAPADVGQGDVPWTVLADPEGHEFCVLALALTRSLYRRCASWGARQLTACRTRATRSFVAASAVSPSYVPDSDSS